MFSTYLRLVQSVYFIKKSVLVCATLEFFVVCVLQKDDYDSVVEYVST